jgi:hypothetical protein
MTQRHEHHTRTLIGMPTVICIEDRMQGNAFVALISMLPVACLNSVLAVACDGVPHTGSCHGLRLRSARCWLTWLPIAVRCLWRLRVGGREHGCLSVCICIVDFKVKENLKNFKSPKFVARGRMSLRGT